MTPSASSSFRIFLSLEPGMQSPHRRSLMFSRASNVWRQSLCRWAPSSSSSPRHRCARMHWARGLFEAILVAMTMDVFPPSLNDRLRFHSNLLILLFEMGGADKSWENMKAVGPGVGFTKLKYLTLTCCSLYGRYM